MRLLQSLIVLAVLLTAGCTDYHPAYLAAVSLPESLSASAPPARVVVYSFRGDCTVTTRRARFVAVNDSTYELRVDQTGGNAFVGCPGGIGEDTFELPRLSAGRVHVRLVGRNTIEAVIHAGARPAAGVRETFRLQGAGVILSDSLRVLLFGCEARPSGSWACSQALAVLAADSLGVATFDTSCALGGLRYRAVVEPSLTPVQREGELHCGTSWQTIYEVGAR